VKKIAHYLSMVKFSHTIFAMPFAAIGFTLGVYALPSAGFDTMLLLYVLLCMVFARNAAMGFNRWADRYIDAKNDRTAQREIPAGKISPRAAFLFIALNSVSFVVTTYFINRLCFYLSPIALATILGYSLTKRFTALCHFVLGAGLSLSPIGAYIAVTGRFALLPILFSFIVFLWTGGFDIIYALQDEDFDREQQLHSIPSKIGRKGSLYVSSFAHLAVALLVVYIGYLGYFSALYWFGAVLFLALLVYQHILVKPDDISKVNLAFGTTNGIASVIYGAVTVFSIIFA